MPLQIKTFLKETPNKGIGLYTDVDLKEGDIIYVDDENFDKIITEEERLLLDEPTSSFIYTYASYNKYKKTWYLCIDDARFFNHDNVSPNTSYNKNFGIVIANRDIKKGEELTSNYREFCDHCADGNFGFEIK